MEALFLVKLAIGWAYYQISNQNEGQCFRKFISICCLWNYVCWGLIIFAIVMFCIYFWWNLIIEKNSI